MPFEDFSEKTWRVITNDSEECVFGSPVRIFKKDEVVTIECGGKDRYPGAKYIENSNRIETDTHEIKLQIVFAPKGSGPITGSWTAEDTSGSPAGDE